MEPDFIATIKLVTGEELISKVSYMPDDDSLVLESPMEVSRIDQTKKNIRVAGFALSEWIHSTFDHMFVLPKKHVLTMTYLKGDHLDKLISEEPDQKTRNNYGQIIWDFFHENINSSNNIFHADVQRLDIKMIVVIVNFL